MQMKKVKKRNLAVSYTHLKEVNNVNVLCFRRLNNKLLLSADISMDTLDVNPEIPYILNVKDNNCLLDTSVRSSRNTWNHSCACIIK